MWYQNIPAIILQIKWKYYLDFVDLPSMADWGSEFNFFQNIYVKNFKNWHFHFHKICEIQQIWIASSYRGVNPFKAR